MDTTHTVRIRSCRTGRIYPVEWENLEDVIRNGTVEPDDAIDFSAGRDDWRRAGDTKLWKRIHQALDGPADTPPVERAAPEEAPPRYPDPMPQGGPDNPSTPGRLRRITFTRTGKVIEAPAGRGFRLLSEPGILSALGVLGVLLYALAMPTPPEARPGDSQDLASRLTMVELGVLVMCVLGLIEHLLRPESRARGCVFLAGPVGVACYGVAALLTQALNAYCQAEVAKGHGDFLIGLLLVYPVVLFGPMLVGIALGVIAFWAGSRVWGTLAALFVLLIFLFFGLLGLVTDERMRHYTPGSASAAIRVVRPWTQPLFFAVIAGGEKVIRRDTFRPMRSSGEVA